MFRVGISYLSRRNDEWSADNTRCSPCLVRGLLFPAVQRKSRVGRPFSFPSIYHGQAVSPAARSSATGLPLGLSADSVTGIISGSAARKGSSIATLTVTDGSFTTTATLQLTFTSDPVRPVILNASAISLPWSIVQLHDHRAASLRS